MPRGPRGLWSGAPRGLAEVGGPHAPVTFPVAHVLTGIRDAPPSGPQSPLDATRGRSADRSRWLRAEAAVGRVAGGCSLVYPRPL